MPDRMTVEAGALIRKVGSRYVWQVEQVLVMGRQPVATLCRTDDPLTRMSVSPQALSDRRLFVPVGRAPAREE